VHASRGSPRLGSIASSRGDAAFAFNLIPQTLKPLNIALVGCGRISKYHFEAIAKVEGLRLVAVCDLDPQRAAAAGASLRVPHFTSIEKMLGASDAEVVSLCTPSGLHPEHGMLAARAGKHVISEKPMAVTLDAGRRLVEAADSAGVRLFVVKQNRLNPPIQLLKRAVDRGRFGKIYMGNVTVRWQRPQEYYDAEPWRGTWAYDGGAFMNQASHYVDLIQWLLGPVESVMAYTATQARRIEAEDSGAALLRFKSGALGVIEVNVLTYPKNYEGSIAIMGERGTVKIGGTAVNRVEHWEFADYDDDDKPLETGSIDTNPPTVYGFGHEGYYRNVLEVLRGNAAPETDGREGLKSLALLQAIYESARTAATAKPAL
jgi:UDP-N-acetyl-2-amino-2-deoxyglucuronate dehydrogenase